MLPSLPVTAAPQLATQLDTCQASLHHLATCKDFHFPGLRLRFRENKVENWWIGLTQQGVQVQVTWFIMYPKLELLCNPSDLKLVAYYDNNALNHTKPLRYIGYFYQVKEFCAKADTNQSRSRVNSDQDSWKLQNSQLHLRSYLLSGRVSPHLTSVILRYSRIDTFQMTWQSSWQQKYGMK